MGGGRLSVFCSVVVTFSALAWLLSIRLANPDPALLFIYPKAHVGSLKDVIRIQARREIRDARDRLLRVTWFVDGFEAGTFDVQIDETTGWAMPMEPRHVTLEEPGTYEFCAALFAVDGGDIRARAAARYSMDVCCPREPD